MCPAITDSHTIVSPLMNDAMWKRNMDLHDEIMKLRAERENLLALLKAAREIPHDADAMDCAGCTLMNVLARCKGIETP